MSQLFCTYPHFKMAEPSGHSLIGFLTCNFALGDECPHGFFVPMVGKASAQTITSQSSKAIQWKWDGISQLNDFEALWIKSSHYGWSVSNYYYMPHAVRPCDPSCPEGPNPIWQGTCCQKGPDQSVTPVDGGRGSMTTNLDLMQVKQPQISPLMSEMQY